MLARKEHKQRIWVNLRLNEVLLSSQEPDVGTLYNLPVVHISFVWKDANDGRALGLICRDSDKKFTENDDESDTQTVEEGQHRFYAIKTEKAVRIAQT